MKFLWFFFFNISVQAVIIQTSRMEDALPYVDRSTWIIFDIDNTLVQVASQAGTWDWYDMEVKGLMASQGVDRASANRIVFQKWDSFMKICPVKIPDEGGAEVVRSLQENSGAALALTARHGKSAQFTLDQFQHLQIDFSDCPLPEIPLVAKHSTHWESGILFGSNNSKGALFRQYLDKLMIKPAKIVFIDDNKLHLESMEIALDGLGIEFLGFHYTKAYEQIFDPEVATKEYQEIMETYGSASF